MSLVRWESLRDVDNLFRHYSPLFGRTLLHTLNERSEWSPTANISETDKEYLIKAELPEVRKEDVRITLENDVITISGERKQQKEHKDENEIRVESVYGTFSRSFSLPENIEAASVTAESKDGVLKVRIPKKELAKPKSLTIQVQ